MNHHSAATVLRGLRRRRRLRFEPGILVLIIALHLAAPRKTRAEQRLDLKTMLYMEDGDRMKIIAPAILYEYEISPSLTIKIEGIYNSITGASPTGAPASTTYTTTSSGGTIVVPTSSPAPAPPPPVIVGDDDDHEDDEFEGDARRGRAAKFIHYAGATPTPTPTPTPAPTPTSTPTSSSSGSGGGGGTTTTTSSSSNGKVPKADVEDTRVGFTVDLIKKLGRHTPSLMLAYSTESDYKSFGLALRDSVDFNKKNTTLMYGGALTHDLVEADTLPSSETKDTVDAMVGVTQLLDPQTFVTVNLTASHVSGYLADPYKVAEVNGVLVAENRPDNKDKLIVFTSLNHYFKALRGGMEGSYRWYNDSFGIQADTFELAWYQKIGPHFVLRPQVRYYEQTAADFYSVRFTGAPEFYSADYRLSALQAFGYGLKFIWTPNDKVSFDLAVDRYEQKGKDSATPPDAYPQANVITAGVRIWF